MAAVLPPVIGLFVCVLVAVLTHSVVAQLHARGALFVERFSARLEIAGVRLKPEDLVAIAFGGGTAIWVACAVLFHASLLIGALLLPVCVGLVCGALYAYVGFRTGRRRETFLTQLESALRLMASGLRIGLSLRLAMSTLIEELDGPARYEFARVIGQTNIGITPYDALDGLAARIPSNETRMFAKVIRIQAQTGGNLAVILEHLASTIKERRRIARKVSALTAEGRIGALVLEALPIMVGGFILLTQRDMAVALLTTSMGHGVLVWVAFLEFLAVLTLNRMLRVCA